MPVRSSWVRQLERMKACRRADDLVREFGEPSHRVPTQAMEIWHYPLGVSGGMLYSVHVSLSGGVVSQTYMHMEPSATVDEQATSRRRPWWKFWARMA